MAMGRALLAALIIVGGYYLVFERETEREVADRAAARKVEIERARAKIERSKAVYRAVCVDNADGVRLTLATARQAGLVTDAHARGIEVNEQLWSLTDRDTRKGILLAVWCAKASPEGFGSARAVGSGSGKVLRGRVDDGVYSE